MSAGNVLYYFKTSDNLMFETVTRVLEEMYEDRRDIVERLTDPRQRLAALIRAGIPDTISPGLRMAYESVPLLRDHPEYRPLHRSIVERQVSLYRSVIEVGAATGAFSPTDDVATIARNLVALEDAYDLYPLIGLDLPPETYRRNVMSYAELALNCAISEPDTERAETTEHR